MCWSIPRNVIQLYKKKRETSLAICQQFVPTKIDARKVQKIKLDRIVLRTRRYCRPFTLWFKFGASLE